MTHRLFILAMMFVLLAPFCSPVNALTENPTALKPTLTISTLDPPQGHAPVTSESVGSVTFHANVSVEKNQFVGTVMVELDGSTSTGWTTVVSPQTIPFTNPATVEITITVVVPQSTPASLIGRVVVNGLATYHTGSISATSSAMVLVDQYFGCALNVSPRQGTGNPQTFEIFIRNTGNGEDSFSLSILVPEALSKAGLSLSFETTKTQKLQPEANQTIKLTVKYGPTAASGNKDFYVRTISNGAKAAGNDSAYTDVMMTINVQPLSGPVGMSIVGGIVAIIVVVGVILFIAKKKGKLRFRKRAKDLPKEKEPVKEIKP